MGGNPVQPGAPAVYNTEKLVSAHGFNAAQRVTLLGDAVCRNILIKWERTIGAKGAWITPLSIALSTGTTAITADFKDVFGVSKSYLAAGNVLICIGALCWAIRSGYVAWQLRAFTTDTIVEELMNIQKEEQL